MRGKAASGSGPKENVLGEMVRVMKWGSGPVVSIPTHSYKFQNIYMQFPESDYLYQAGSTEASKADALKDTESHGKDNDPFNGNTTNLFSRAILLKIDAFYVVAWHSCLPWRDLPTPLDISSGCRFTLQHVGPGQRSN